MYIFLFGDGSSYAYKSLSLVGAGFFAHSVNMIAPEMKTKHGAI